VPTIGSFGFATPNKGFERIVQLVQSEFENAIIRINMASADFGDVDGINARRVADRCRCIVNKPGISLEITHDFLNKDKLLDFLSVNSMNVFLYEDVHGRGLSSALDNALAVRRPIAVSNSPMFRHVLSVVPSVCADFVSLRTILAEGFGPLRKVTDDWTSQNLSWDYDRILTRILAGKAVSPKSLGPLKTIQSKINRFFTRPDKTFTWLRTTAAEYEDDLRPDSKNAYQPIDDVRNFNRILDDDARALYKPSISKLFELVPKTMSKKIDRANVQQAFVFDTVYRHLKSFVNPKLLCVGSYEDTASMALKKLGWVIDEVDPMLNYYLQEYYTKPSTKKAYYDIIFSTSVIEHDPDDKSFIEAIDGLLSENGVAVITCDYKDGWKPGEPKPDVDARFYTKFDLEKRLLSYAPSWELIDKPQWDCPRPDFNYLGKYQYTFATFVIRKKSLR
jgi:hypothetical protein